VIPHVYAPIDHTTNWCCHNIPAIKALGTKVFRSVTGADGAAAQMAIGTSAVMTAALPGRSVVAALGRANDERPPQVEHTQTEETIEDEGGNTSTRQTQQTRIEAEGGGSLTMQRGVEEGQHPDGTPYVRTEQEMRVEDGTGGSMQARSSMQMGGEVVNMMREMRQQHQQAMENSKMWSQQAIEHSQKALEQSQKTRQEIKQQSQQAIEHSQQQSQRAIEHSQSMLQETMQQSQRAIEHSQQAMQHSQQAMEVIKQQSQQAMQNMQQQSNAQGGPAPPPDQAPRTRGRPSRSPAGAARNAQGGSASPAPAPPAAEAPRKRGRPPKSSRAGSAGAAYTETAAANNAKRGRTAWQNIESYPREEKSKDEAMEFLFEKWDTHITPKKKLNSWIVHYIVDRTEYKSPHVSFEEACYLRRQLCVSSKKRDEDAINLWPHLKTCSKPMTLYNDAITRFDCAKRGLY
jgi:hypothetical protein